MILVNLLKLYKAKVVNDEMHFKYVTEDQFNSCIGSNDNNIELSVFHMNIRSLNSKHKLLCQFLDLLHLSFDVIILSKIWSSNISFYWNIFPGYTFYYDLPVLHLALVVWAFFLLKIRLCIGKLIHINLRDLHHTCLGSEWHL